MRILFVAEYFSPVVQGGGEINLAQTAQALVQAGQEVHLLTSHSIGLPVQEERQGLQIHRHLRSGKSPFGIISQVQRRFLFSRSVIRETARLQKQLKFDRIHFQGISIIAAPSLKALGVPLFATVESYPALCPKGDRFYYGKEPCQRVCSPQLFFSCQRACSEIGKTKNRWYLKYNPIALIAIYSFYYQLRQALASCQLIAISSYVQKVLGQHGFSSKVIPNVIEIKLPKKGNQKKGNQKKRNKLEMQNGKTTRQKRILFLGTLSRAKGPQILIEALAGTDLQAELYGTGPLQKELQQRIQELGVQATIHEPIPNEEVPFLYQQADIIVFPSLWPEPFGRIPLEAQAVSKPVIASDVGAIPDVSTVHLVPPGDVIALREALLHTSSTSITASSMSTDLSRYHPSQVAAALLNTYRETP